MLLSNQAASLNMARFAPVSVSRWLGRKVAVEAGVAAWRAVVVVDDVVDETAGELHSGCCARQACLLSETSLCVLSLLVVARSMVMVKVVHRCVYVEL